MSPDAFAATVTWVVGLIILALVAWAVHYASAWWPRRWDELRRRLGG